MSSEYVLIKKIGLNNIERHARLIAESTLFTHPSDPVDAYFQKLHEKEILNGFKVIVDHDSKEALLSSALGLVPPSSNPLVLAEKLSISALSYTPDVVDYVDAGDELGNALKRIAPYIMNYMGQDDEVVVCSRVISLGLVGLDVVITSEDFEFQDYGALTIGKHLLFGLLSSDESSYCISSNPEKSSGFLIGDKFYPVGTTICKPIFPSTDHLLNNYTLDANENGFCVVEQHENYIMPVYNIPTSLQVSGGNVVAGHDSSRNALEFLLEDKKLFIYYCFYGQT